MRSFCQEFGHKQLCCSLTHLISFDVMSSLFIPWAFISIKTLLALSSNQSFLCLHLIFNNFNALTDHLSNLSKVPNLILIGWLILEGEHFLLVPLNLAHGNIINSFKLSIMIYYMLGICKTECGSKDCRRLVTLAQC